MILMIQILNKMCDWELQEFENVFFKQSYKDCCKDLATERLKREKDMKVMVRDA